MLFTFRSRYWCTIGPRDVQTCRYVTGVFVRDNRPALLDRVRFPSRLSYGAITLFGPAFQGSSPTFRKNMDAPTFPFRDSGRSSPSSLAATEGITIVFSSCPYYNALVGGVPAPV